MVSLKVNGREQSLDIAPDVPLLWALRALAAGAAALFQLAPPAQAATHALGSPAWHLPPESMRMPFEGLTPAQLCAQLKDPKRNGGKTLDALLEHVAHDPLVLWGWEPGEGRSKPPLTHAEFVRQMRLWVENGAACPE